MYRLRSIRKEYGPIVALDVGELAIVRGRLHMLTGSNGAGKSTLLGILAFLSPPTSGEVFYAGRRVDWAGDAVAARDGGLLVALESTVEMGTLEGTVVSLALADGAATVAAELPEGARFAGNIPSTLVPFGGALLAGPSAYAPPPQGCVTLLAADLSGTAGCFAPGTHRGVALGPGP